MNNKEFLAAIALVVKEKGIPEETIFAAMELALASAYKKHTGLPNAKVIIDHDTGDIKVYSFITVVDEVVEPDIEITLKEAKKINKELKVGDTIDTLVDTKDFGRVAASTAKQVVIQKIRELAASTEAQDELVSGTVAMEDVRNYYIDLGKTQGILPKAEMIPGEKLVMGSNIKVYITKVSVDSKGALILLSRSHYGFVKRLFEHEIPEIREGIIMVYSVAREAGIRTKIAVFSENSRVDAVGSCIGERGSRINNILKEMGPEKVDIIGYNEDSSKFIENALSPAKNLRVFITDENRKEALVIVDDDNLSLAIGKKGLNVRLAARLTHFKIDVKTKEQAKENGINVVD